MTGYPLAGQRALAEIVSPGPWIAFTFANSWSNTGGGVVTAQYRLWPLMNALECIGNVTHASVAGTSLFAASLVAPYLPVSQQCSAVQKVIATNQFAVQASGPFVILPTTGAIQFQFLPAGTTQVEFRCFFSLDA
jgi:hypothetical protein